MDEKKGKLFIAGSLLVLVLAGVILFLFVIPGINGTGQTMAQEEGGPPAEAGPPGGGPGGPPGGGPAGPPGAEGGPGAAPAAGGGGVETATDVETPPLEASRTNPFVSREEGAGAGSELDELPFVTQYGTNWSRLPITARLGFVRPNVPARRAVTPPTPEEEPSFDISITGMLWTPQGDAIVSYRSGRNTGDVRAGDIVDGWQVVEIWRDRMVVADRETGRRQTIHYTPGGATPPKPATPTPPAGGGQRQRPGRQPGMPAAPGGGAPAAGMPPPVR